MSKPCVYPRCSQDALDHDVYCIIHGPMPARGNDLSREIQNITAAAEEERGPHRRATNEEARRSVTVTAEIRPGLLSIFSRPPRRMLHVTGSWDGGFVIRTVADGAEVVRVGLDPSRGLPASVVLALVIVGLVAGFLIGRAS